MTLSVDLVGLERLDDVWHVVRAAFDSRPPLDPPADAASDTRDAFAAALRSHGGLLATRDGAPVGALLLDPSPQGLVLRRFGVVPAERHQGIATAMVDAAVRIGLGHTALIVLARAELPRTVAFWEEHGFVEFSREAPYVELRRPLARTVQVPDADQMRALGERVGSGLRAGDVVVLTGELGAGKTTFTQGLGVGLGVRGQVTSPTFVIARVHPSLVGGPSLVHVDAYRIGGIDELDDLDLDASLEEAVTVVEWGAGLAETLAPARLEIVIERALGADAPVDEDSLDPRVVRFARVLPE